MEYLVLDPKAGKYLNHPYRELTEFLQGWEVVKSCTVLRQVLCSILSWLPKICLRNAFPQGLSHSLPRSGIFFFLHSMALVIPITPHRPWPLLRWFVNSWMGLSCLEGHHMPGLHQAPDIHSIFTITLQCLWSKQESLDCWGMERRTRSSEAWVQVWGYYSPYRPNLELK